jgi:hypothetical protein
MPTRRFGSLAGGSWVGSPETAADRLGGWLFGTWLRQAYTSPSAVTSGCHVSSEALYPLRRAGGRAHFPRLRWVLLRVEVGLLAGPSHGGSSQAGAESAESIFGCCTWPARCQVNWSRKETLLRAHGDGKYRLRQVVLLPMCFACSDLSPSRPIDKTGSPMASTFISTIQILGYLHISSFSLSNYIFHHGPNPV